MKKILGLILIVFFGIQCNAQSACTSSLSEDLFQIELKKIKAYDFDQAKKKDIENLLNQCPTCNQIKQLLHELSFEQDKLDIIKKAYSKVSDPINFTVIKAVLNFEESKNIINELIKE